MVKTCEKLPAIFICIRKHPDYFSDTHQFVTILIKMDFNIFLLFLALTILFLSYFLLDVNYFIRAVFTIFMSKFFRKPIKFYGKSAIYGETPLRLVCLSRSVCTYICNSVGVK